MYLKRPLTELDGLQPSQAYLLSFRIRFASNAAGGCPGSGGSAGDSVYLKAGGSPQEPIPLLNGTFVDINVDKGFQAEGGQNAGVVSNIANGRGCHQTPKYVMLTRTYQHPFPISTSNDGQLWIMVGTDSAFEDLTALYYSEIDVKLTPTSN